MKKNTAFRVQNMTVRTSVNGEHLTISSGRRSVRLTAEEANKLCRWMIGLFQIEFEMQDLQLGRWIRTLAQLPDVLTDRLHRHSMQQRREQVALSTYAPPPKRAVRKAKAHK